MSSWSVDNLAISKPFPSDMQSVTSENAIQMLVDSTPEPFPAVSNAEHRSPSPSRASTRSSVVIRRRGTDPAATKILKEWLRTHSDHPYPSQDQKRDLCARTKLSMSQVSNWIICARKAHPPKRSRTTDEGQSQDIRAEAHYSVSSRDNTRIGGPSYFSSPSIATFPSANRASL